MRRFPRHDVGPGSPPGHHTVASSGIWRVAARNRPGAFGVEPHRFAPYRLAILRHNSTVSPVAVWPVAIRYNLHLQGVQTSLQLLQRPGQMARKRLPCRHSGRGRRLRLVCCRRRARCGRRGWRFLSSVRLSSSPLPEGQPGGMEQMPVPVAAPTWPTTGVPPATTPCIATARFATTDSPAADSR